MNRVKATFIYNGRPDVQLTFPQSPKHVAAYLGCTLPIIYRPIAVYFEGRLIPEEERSVIYCSMFRQWQYECLSQVHLEEKK
jgi:hypothetical protein